MKLLVSCIVYLHGLLPLPICRLLGRCYGNLIFLLNTRIKKTTIRNIEYCLPDFSNKQKSSLTYQSCIHTGMAMAESFWIWARPAAEIFNRLNIINEHLLTDHLTNKQGAILTGPHLGCWEIITIWAAKLKKTSALYRPIKVKELDQIVKRGRSKTGAEMLEGTTKSLRRILTGLKKGEIFVVLSDQEPANGSGVYAPFFNQLAYTMTLPQQLLIRTNAKLLLFSIHRTKPGWTVKISEPENIDGSCAKQEFATQLNKNLEALIRLHMPQFEWGYKRFKTPPDGDYDFYPE